MDIKAKLPKVSLPKVNIATPVNMLKKTVRFIIMKTIGLCFSVVFLVLGAYFLGHSLAATASTVKGHDAKITDVSNQIGKFQTACRVGGLFVVTAEIEKKKYEKIYCLYPAWPDLLQPTKGDVIQVWPAKQPLAGAPLVDGWAWFIVGTFFIVGLVMLEFAFLVLTIA